MTKPPSEPAKNEYNLSDQRTAMAALDRERVTHGMSLGDMEEKSGVSVNSVYAWRNCQRSPHLCNIVAIAETFGFEVVMRRKTPL
ncbi:helix-turn-helix domain-containing protein [Agrobacterium sp. rho-8.1]|nr:helix-turn-helix transcriptional regulator [Agrobacterium sp. rho-8.1]